MKREDTPILFPTEPDIRVRIHTAGAPLLSPRGEYDIAPDKETVRYIPRNDISEMVLENQAIGLGFHWMQSVRSVLRGKFEVRKDSEEKWAVYNTLPVEKYLMSVVGSEMNPEAPSEFLKAHAVISRGWALSRIVGMSRAEDDEKVSTNTRIITWEDDGDHDDCDVCADDHCQRYQGMGEGNMNAAASEAVETTRGLVLTAPDGSIADTRFSKCCGGMTELFSTCWQDRDYGYLLAQEDPWCSLSGMSESAKRIFLSRSFRNYDIGAAASEEWEVRVPKSELGARLREKHSVDIGEVKSIEALRRGPSGRVSELEIRGSGGTVALGKELAIRRLLHPSCLYSSAFDIDDEADSFVLRGHGWGHGVGLCQTGAARMAMEGASFVDILNFYYPSTSLTCLYD